MSPAETLNGITLGAAHADGSGPSGNPNLIDPFTGAELPSTISAHGPEYFRTIKPGKLDVRQAALRLPDEVEPGDPAPDATPLVDADSETGAGVKADVEGAEA